MALIIVVLGFLVSLPFQFLIPEKQNVKLCRLKWYKWFANIDLYLVSYYPACMCSRDNVISLGVPVYYGCVSESSYLSNRFTLSGVARWFSAEFKLFPHPHYML